jgi:hypothetical protein
VRASSADLITHDEGDQSGTIPPVPTQLTELPMWQSARPIETAPHDTAQERPFLLWCPEQGGWQTGVWFNGRWMDSITLNQPLAPTYWTEIPPPPMQSSRACGTEYLAVADGGDANRLAPP